MISTGTRDPVFALSTDDLSAKNLPNGQVVIIMDTGEVKYWDAENGALVP